MQNAIKVRCSFSDPLWLPFAKGRGVTTAIWMQRLGLKNMFAYNSLEAAVRVNLPKSQIHAESFPRSLMKALIGTKYKSYWPCLNGTHAYHMQSFSKSLQAAWWSINEYQFTQANFPCFPVPDPCHADLKDADQGHCLHDLTHGYLDYECFRNKRSDFISHSTCFSFFSQPQLNHSPKPLK